MKKVFKVKEKDSILQEYEEIRKELGKAKYEALNKYLATHKNILLSDVYYNENEWNKFDAWFRNGMKDGGITERLEEANEIIKENLEDSISEQEALAQIVKADNRFSDPRTQIKYVGKAKTTTGKEMDKYVVGIKGGPIQYNAYFWENGKLNYISTAPKGTINDAEDFITYFTNKSFSSAGNFLDYVHYKFGDYKWSNNSDGSMNVVVNGKRYRVTFDYSNTTDPDAKCKIKSIKAVDRKSVKDADPTYRSVWLKVKEYVKNHYNFNYKNDFKGLMDFLNNQYGGSIDEDKVYDILRDLNGKGYIAFVKDSKLKDAHIYLFAKSDINRSDIEEAKKYGLEVLGTNRNGSEVNLVMRGDLANLKKYAKEYLDYVLHPGYLYRENEFAGKITRDEEIKNTDKAPNSSMVNELKRKVEEFKRRGYDEEDLKITVDGNKVWFTGELSYSTHEKLANELDKIVAKYDKDAYFDAETSGRWVAHFFDNSVKDDEVYHLTKEQWNKIPNAYKGKTPDGKRTVFAAFVYPNGGTTLLTEGAHFVIDGKSKVKDTWKHIENYKDVEIYKDDDTGNYGFSYNKGKRLYNTNKKNIEQAKKIIEKDLEFLGKDSKLSDAEEVVARYKENGNIIPIIKVPSGKYYYEQAEHLGLVGPYNTLEEAQKYLMKHKPQAKRLDSKMKDYQSYVGFAGAEKLKQDIKNYNGNPVVFSYFLKPKQASSIELMGAIINKQEFFLTMVMKTATYKGDLAGAKKDALRAIDEITKTWKSLSYEDNAIKDGKYVVNNMNDLKRLFTNFPKGDVDISYGRSGFYYHIRPKADGKVSLGSAGYDGTFNTLKEALEWVVYDFRDLILNVNPDGSDRDNAIKDNKTYKVTHKDKSYKVKAKSKRDAALIVARKVK